MDFINGFKPLKLFCNKTVENTYLYLRLNTPYIFTTYFVWFGNKRSANHTKIKTLAKLYTHTSKENIEGINVEEEFSEEEIKIFCKIPDAAFTALRKMIERINIMSENELVDKLRCFRLDAQGDVETLRKVLKNSYKKIILATIDINVSPHLLPYYVIIDFEATCEEVNPPKFRHEIIEFPAVIVNSKNQEITDCFQMYCKPEINPKISKFCTDLTGITQEQVDSAETFDKVLEHFQNWLAKHNLGVMHKYGIVTDGPWDMSKFLYSQCHYSDVKFPKWATKWVNLRKTFSKFYQTERVCLKNMLDFLEMDFVGRPHCGLDDAKNIARILLRMIYDGANIQINERVTVSKTPKQNVKEQGNQEMANGDCKKNELNEKMQKLRIEAHYTTIYYTEEMPVYKKNKRDRHIAEAQIARKILNNHNLWDPIEDQKTNSSRKKLKKVKKES